jgi:hypothetical protein
VVDVDSSKGSMTIYYESSGGIGTGHRYFCKGGSPVRYFCKGGSPSSKDGSPSRYFCKDGSKSCNSKVSFMYKATQDRFPLYHAHAEVV